MRHSLFVGGILEVLHKLGNIVIIVVLHLALASPNTQTFSIFSQSVHALRAQLVENSRKQFRQLLRLHITADNKGVGGN